MSVDAPAFKAALSRFAAGITVITVQSETGEDHGMTASAFCSLSLDPPLVLVCVQQKAQIHRHMAAALGWGVNILAEGQSDLSNRFAGFTAVADRWADLNLRRGPLSQAPWIGGALVHLDCSPYAMLPGGDHTIFIGQVEHAELVQPDGKPLIYYRGYHTLAPPSP